TALTGEVILIRDITRLREMEMQYERNKRLIAMGEMAAHIVHEIRNPLCSIELFATMLEKEILTDRGKELSRGISSGIRSLNTILTNMLIFARPGSINPRPISSSDILSGVFQMLGPILNSSNVTVHCSKNEFLLMGDRELLIQAILNIVINAIQAMPEGGTVWINVYEGDGLVNFSIRDTGRGIEPEIMDRIFDPFFTTKDNGTGLGLAITAKIIQAHGGLINVNSEPGRGSEFILSLPKREEEKTEVSTKKGHSLITDL
ncbi:MAG: ATP-binding protein, partial [Thermodesulfovibrionales bacterium]|nr:ATP-binding protein [Thermodesulfovibrionales bacterium]